MVVKLNSKIRNYTYDCIVPLFHASVNRINGSARMSLQAKYAKNDWKNLAVMIKYFRKNVVFSLRQTSYI